MDNKQYRNIKEFNGIRDYLKYQRSNANNNYVKKSNFDYLKVYDNLDYLAPSNRVEIKRIDFKPLMAAPPEVKESTFSSRKEAESEVVDIFTLQDGVENGKQISRLFSLRGLVYKFDRGLVMLDGSGKKVEEILDFTGNHHADRVPKIATEIFGREIAYQGPSTEFIEALEAASKGLVTMLFEGNKCIMIVPNDLNVKAIDGIIAELEPRNDFIFTVAREDGTFVENLSRNIVLDYYKDQKKKKEREAAEEIVSPDKSDKLSIEEYIDALLKFIEENSISLKEYYRNIGRIHRTKDNVYLPDFEKKNPFIDENDIRLLLENEDHMIIEYFARAMFRVINSNIDKNNNKQKEKSTDDTKTKKKDDPVKNPEGKVPEKKELKLSIKDYIKELLKFIEENNISLMEYYRNIGRIHRTKENSYLPLFERKNPFLDDNDIRLLLESDNHMIIEYFARAMTRVINLNITKDNNITKKEEPIKEPTPKKKESPVEPPKEEKTEKKLTPKDLLEIIKEKPESIVESISQDILEDIDGYAVVRDDEHINIYSYDGNDKSSLKNRTTYNASDYSIKSGYYVSIDSFLAAIRNKHSDCKVSFLTETGNEIDYNAIENTLEELCVEQGGITTEKENKRGNSYYINRHSLRIFLSKFRVKYTPINEKGNLIKM